MTNIEIINTIRTHLEEIRRLTADLDATHDTWGELASHEEEKSFGDAEYAQIDAYAHHCNELNGEIRQHRFIIQHLYCVLDAIDTTSTVRMEIEAEGISIPYGWVI